MFDNLLSFWRGKDFLQEVLHEFETMLTDTEYMFRDVSKKLLEGKSDPALKGKIYSIDKEVNRIEKEIRRRIVTHLTVQANVDLPLSLILMSVVKDAERLGDYAKNIYEVTEMLESPINRNDFKELFGGITEKLINAFSETRSCFMKSDKDTAFHTINMDREITKKCDDIIEKLSKSDYKANTAVCFTLLARYFKRTSSHLSNISSSVVLPIQELDFFGEKYKKEQK